MNTVILKWNPGISTYSMLNYLYDVTVLNQGYPACQNWSVLENETIQKGDRFYWLKLGLGQVGIIGCGTISSDPYEDLDWASSDRQIFYVDLAPEVLLCPEVVPLLSSETLEKKIPDFDWSDGKSGMILNRHQSKQLNDLWEDYYNTNKSLWKEIKEKSRIPDTIYLTPKKSCTKTKKEKDSASSES